MTGAAMCELDPITWDALVDAMKSQGVEEATIGRICHDALRAINSTPESERTRRSVEAVRNIAGRRAGRM